MQKWTKTGPTGGKRFNLYVVGYAACGFLEGYSCLVLPFHFPPSARKDAGWK